MNVSEIAEVYIDDIEIPDAPAAGPSNDVKPAQEKKDKGGEGACQKRSSVRSGFGLKSWMNG